MTICSNWAVYRTSDQIVPELIITFSSASGTGCMIVSLHDCFIANVAIFLFRTSIIGSIFDNCSCSGTYATTTCGLYGRSATTAG